MGLKNFLKILKNEIFPKGITCNVCGKELSEKDREYSLCEGCAAQLNDVSSSLAEYGGTGVFSCFRYEDTARKYVLDYKDSNKPYLAEYMAKYMFSLFDMTGVEVDCACYVPSSPSAMRRRGYDAMKTVAEFFSEISGVPVNNNLFREDGVDQTKVGMANRDKNVKGKFFSKGDFPERVLLLDDVVTSGATLKECKSIIESCGGKEVTCLTFARAEHGAR